MCGKISLKSFATLVALRQLLIIVSYGSFLRSLITNTSEALLVSDGVNEFKTREKRFALKIAHFDRQTTDHDRWCLIHFGRNTSKTDAAQKAPAVRSRIRSETAAPHPLHPRIRLDPWTKIGQPGSIPALVPPVGMATRHRKCATAEQLAFYYLSPKHAYTAPIRSFTSSRLGRAQGCLVMSGDPDAVALGISDVGVVLGPKAKSALLNCILVNNRLCAQAAVGTFNFLNSEGRYVAAALIPPRRLDIYDPEDRQASRLLVAEEERTTQDLLEAEQQTQELKLLTDSSTKPIESYYGRLSRFHGILVEICEPNRGLFRCHGIQQFRRLSQTVPQQDQPQDMPDKPKRLWPRQGSLESKFAVLIKAASTYSVNVGGSVLFFQELLDYPELPKIEDVNKACLLHERVKNLVLQVNSAEIDRDNQLDRETLATLAKHGLFGLQIGENYGGRNLSYTYAARVWEALGLDGAVFAVLDAHNNLAARSIVLRGNEDQKRSFLPPLATGKCMAAFCLSELCSGSDLSAIKTRAIRSSDGQTYTISGSKNWITNGALANLLITFARVEPRASEEVDSPNPVYADLNYATLYSEEGTGGYGVLYICRILYLHEDSANITAFVVERTQRGVHFTNVLDTFGLRGSNVTDIFFDDVNVPASNILGTVGSGLQLAQQVIDEQRLNIAAACTGLLRYIISYAAEHCLQRHQFGHPLGDFGLVQAKLSNLALNVYAMESALFYLTGLLDAQPQRDLTLEKAALKLYSSEALWKGVNECMQLAGRMGLSKEVPFERYLRDARSLLIHGGTSEMLRLLIAGSGLQAVGPERQEEMERLRFFTRHPITTFKASFRIRARKRGWFAHKVGAGLKVTEGGASRALKDHLHPNFELTATRLAVLCQRFQSLVETSLIYYRASILNEQIILARMADCAVDLFLVSVCLARASRAISIGIHLHDYEVRLATTFAKVAFQRIEANLNDVPGLDRDHHRIASEILARRAYPVAHPITRVW
ncbi:acyl-CoA dehydrogenase family member 9 [Clonorchis sinensis]|uniref:Acyl-CoA dehydrogenase family member 9 n=1 Tax=Clonorchis sinensis TaxID=79923 RepID=G7YDG7_CLOSI|nr:acyl-CoA dehydrogenase family member 9 [Clonorchis sinensis]